MSTTYEVNANGGRHYTSDSATKVAGVAATWAKQGHAPKAYAKLDGAGGVRVVEVPVTTARPTAACLKSAR